jgi:membrane protease YdiL (CAAX protease family)
METIPSRPSQPPGYPWRIFWGLLIASMLGVAALLLYVFGLFGKIILSRPLPMPLSVLIVVQFMENGLLFAAIISLGILLARKVGIETPVLRRWLYSGQGVLQGAVGVPVVSGVAVGALILLAFYKIFFPQIPEWPIAVEAMLPIWKRFLACFYGAINEELLARLFFFSLLLWLLRKIAREKSPQAGVAIFWIANVIVALLFAAGHIPSAKLFMPITPIVLAAIFSINGVASLLFGYLCWKRGLEAAMLAHFSTDIMLHVVGPMFFRA